MLKCPAATSFTQSTERAYRYFPDLSLPSNPASKDFYIVTSDLHWLTPWPLYDCLIEDWAVCEDFVGGWVQFCWELLWCEIFFSDSLLLPSVVWSETESSFFLLILPVFGFCVLWVFSWCVPVSPCLPKLRGLCPQARGKLRAQVHWDKEILLHSVCEFSSTLSFEENASHAVFFGLPWPLTSTGYWNCPSIQGLWDGWMCLPPWRMAKLSVDIRFSY